MLASVRDAQDTLFVLTAFGGGIISFLSPCVLPIVPGYLSLVSGVTLAELEEGRAGTLRRITLHTSMFVLGFTVVFVLLGLSTTAIGGALIRNQSTLTRVSGGFVLLMALYLAGSQLLRAPGLYREVRFHPRLERFGPAAALVAGVAFSLGWTVCIGPILGSVLGLAATGNDLGRASVLLVAYSLGLGLSFLVVGLAFGRFAAPMKWVRRHGRALTLVSAAVLGVFGIILLADQLPWLTARFSDAMRWLGLGDLVTIG